MRIKGAEARQMELLGYLGEIQKESSNWRKAYEKMKEGLTNSGESQKHVDTFHIEEPK
jgi:hypothetical protein